MEVRILTLEAQVEVLTKEWKRAECEVCTHPLADRTAQYNNNGDFAGVYCNKCEKRLIQRKIKI